MKGKGKKEKDNDVDECPLQFLDFEQLDATRHCPRFSAILQRTDEEGGVGFEDLDALQLEIEMMLVSVVQRQGQLDREMEALMNWHDAKHREKKSPVKSQPETPGKRSKQQQDEKPSKRFKDSHIASGSAGSSGKSSHSTRPHKAKNTKYTDTEYADPVIEMVSKHLPFKNDIPDQFWSFIEPFCCDLTQEHVKTLQEAYKSYEDNSEYYKIPNLGKHYSLKREKEDDLISDRKDNSKYSSNSPNKKKKGLSASNNSSSSSPASGKSPKKLAKDASEVSFGALTQRLVSCLIEENLLSSNMSADGKQESNGNGKSVGSNGSGSNGNNLLKSLNLGNTAQLERRIRKELEQLGIVSMEEIMNSESINTEEDEVLNELKRCQEELKSVSSKNQSHMKRLITLTKKQIAKQDVYKKLQNADLEVIEAYRKVIVAKQKKKSPTKKEKEQAWKALKERESIMKQM